MTEADVSTKIRKTLVTLGAVAWKMSDRFHASRPDLLAWHTGRAFAIETKIFPNVVTDLQNLTLIELREAGVSCYIATFNKLSKYLILQDMRTNQTVSFKDIRGAGQWLLRQHC